MRQTAPPVRNWAQLMKRLPWVWLVGALLMVAHPCTAETRESEPSDEDKAKARALAQTALGYMHEEQWANALPLLEEAYRLMPAPTLSLLRARSLEELGRLIEARASYRHAAELDLGPDVPDAFRSAQREARASLESLDQRVPRLTLVMRGPGSSDPMLEVRVNGNLIKNPEQTLDLDPGTHRVAVQRGAKLLLSTEVELTEQEQKSVLLAIPEADRAPSPTLEPPQSNSPRKIAGWVAFGVGGTGLTLGAVTGIMMLSAKGKLDRSCNTVCPPSSADTLERFRTTRTISSVAYGVGFFGLAVGVVMLATGNAEEQSSERRIALFSTGSQIGVRGSFE